MPVNEKQSEIYESYTMLHKDGTLMCHCNAKKANWYIKRNLAEWVGEKTFRLNFEPKGHGKADQPFYTQKIENKCVVCGSTELLNKHHVVPYVFRSRFPKAYKESNHHDIVAICTTCHESYEALANMYKKQLALEAGTTTDQASMTEEARFNTKVCAARSLLAKPAEELAKIPAERIAYLKETAALELRPVPVVEGTHWADVVLEKTLQDKSLFEFVKMWRQHFIDHMKPEYLPNGWDVNYPLEFAGNAET